MAKRGKQRQGQRAASAPHPASDPSLKHSATSAEPSARSPIWQRPWFVPAFYALVAVAYFYEFPLSDKIIYGEDVGMDFHKGKAPVLQKLAELEPSAWDPRMGGYPISEEIRHKFFPTYLIELFTTRQRTIGWRYIFAVFGAGWGMFLYLRQLGVGRLAALWTGFAFLSAPTFLSFPYAGQYAKMTVIALFPFYLLCLEKGMAGGRSALRWYMLLGVLIALGVFSPHLQMLQYALLGLGIYFLFRLYRLYRGAEAGAAPFRSVLERTGLFAFAVVLGLSLGAEGLFPPYQHVRTQSKRAAIQDDSGRTEEQQLALARSWSLHPEEAVSLLVPEFGGFRDPKNDTNTYWGRNPMKLNSEYFGILVVLLALLILPEARRWPIVIYMSGLFVLVLAFTLGEHTPVHWIAYHVLPGGQVLRTIGMAAFLFAFPACVLAGLALHRCLTASDSEERQQLQSRTLKIGGGLTAALLLMAIAPSAVMEGWVSLIYSDIAAPKRQIMVASAEALGRGALIVALICGAGTALLVLRLRRSVNLATVVIGLFVLTMLDTWRIDRLFLRYEDPTRWQDFRTTNSKTVTFLEAQPGKFRIFPIPEYGYLSNPRYYLHGADVVTAFNNYTLRRYDRLLKEFLAVERVFYARMYRRQEVPYSDDQLLAAIHPLLNLVNARYLVTPKEISLQAQHFPEVFAEEGVRLYENRFALPWLQLVADVTVMENETQIIEALREGRVDLRQTAIVEAPLRSILPGLETDRSDDRIELEEYDHHDGVIRLRTSVGGPRLLVISDNYHPHWQATIDARPSAIHRANYLWRGIEVPAGEHVVRLTYYSKPVQLARTASGVSALVVLGFVGWQWRRRSKNDAEAGVAATAK
ncbi:MAG: hypothetical protein VX733_03410 [Candidatus Latescibacterota bacterium]|nr:hypothetical protein [Candidatus Latescibacterota bacterium]